MRDVSRCGCEFNSRARIVTLRPTRTTQSRRENKQGRVRQVARATEEQLREDLDGLETHEQKKKTEDAKRMRGIVHNNNKNRRLSRVQKEMGNLMHHDEQELLSVWEGWHWDDNKGERPDLELCAKARREEVEYIRCHKTHTRSPGKLAPVRLEGHSGQDGRRRTRDNQGGPTCARGGSLRNTRLKRGQRCARRRRLERCCRRSSRANVEEK